MNWWRRLRGSDRLEAELDAELRFHVEAEMDGHMRNGLATAEARRRARITFGGLDQAKEGCRDARGARWIEEALQDVRFAARLLAKDRSFTLAAVVALALGIGASSTVFTAINAMHLSGPGNDPDRIVWLGTRDPSGRIRGVSHADYQDWSAATRAFDGLAAHADASINISDEGRSPNRVVGAYISADAFRLLGERPILGRNFLPEDDRPGAPAVAILEGGLWRRRYEKDPAIVGRTIALNGVPSIVIGVMREGFQFPAHTDLWQPLASMPGIADQARDRRTLGMFGRLANSIGIPQATAALDAIAARLARDHPDTNRDIRPAVMTFGQRFGGRLTDPIPLSLMGAVGFVLLIACANVANLLLARSVPRSREISIRASVGATRWRIVRQLLVESAVLAGLAGALGLAISRLWVPLIADAVAQSGVYWMQFTLDGRVFTFLVVACFAATALFGLAPALHLSRAEVSGTLKEGIQRRADSPRARRSTSALLSAEIAMTLVLLAGAGLMVRSFLVLYRADLVVDTSNVLTMELVLPDRQYPTTERRLAFYQRLEDRLELVVGSVASATLASARPFLGGSDRPFLIDGQSVDQQRRAPSVTVVTIGARYFETLGLRLVRGRSFTAVDGLAGHEHVVVNERFAAMFLPGVDPVGRRIRLAGDNASGPSSEGPDGAPWLTIVGVAPTVRQNVAGEAGPVAYLPYRAGAGPSAALIVRGRADAGAVTSALREALRGLDPDLPLFNIRPLDDVMALSRMQHRLFGAMLALFACIGLVLSAVGLAATTAYAVTQRTHEVGVRMALGAQTRDVLRLFLRRTVAVLGVGLTAGIVGAIGVGMLLRGLLIQTRAVDPVTLTCVVTLLVAVALTACLLPARRATRLDPVAALRHE